jgi:hypothetical protein
MNIKAPGFHQVAIKERREWLDLVERREYYEIQPSTRASALTSRFCDDHFPPGTTVTFGTFGGTGRRHFDPFTDLPLPCRDLGLGNGAEVDATVMAPSAIEKADLSIPKGGREGLWQRATLPRGTRVRTFGLKGKPELDKPEGVVLGVEGRNSSSPFVSAPLFGLYSLSLTRAQSVKYEPDGEGWEGGTYSIAGDNILISHNDWRWYMKSVCACCGKRGEKLQKCGGCRVLRYCDRT